MQSREYLLPADWLLRVSLFVHLNPKLVRLVDALRGDRDVPNDNVGALVPRNLALGFHHGVLVGAIAEH